MTMMEKIAKIVADNPGKTAGELAELSGYSDKKVMDALTHCIKRSFLRRERRNISPQRPNVGIWIYYAS